MTRLASTLVILSLLSFTSLAHANDGYSMLTGKTRVTGDVVTVGDLFTNAGSHASHALAPSPALGEKLVLSKYDLLRVAQAFRLKWSPEENLNTVSIERDGIAVDQDMINEALASSELHKSVSDNSEFQVTNLGGPIVIDGLEPVDLTIEKASFDASNETFHAKLVISRNDEKLKTLNIAGVATPMMNVATLRYPTSANHLISEDDILEIKVPQKKLRAETIVSKNDLLGMTTKRSLLAGQLLSSQDVTPPVLVRRNELVTVVYQNGPVQLSTKARAMSNGVKGDTVTMINTTSKKTFDAVVTGPQTAAVNING